MDKNLDDLLDFINDSSATVNKSLKQYKVSNKTKDQPETGKKKKKKSKKEEQDEEELLKANEERQIFEERLNKWKSFFDFSKVTLSESRFQDNCHLRIVNNWEDKSWKQTYDLLLFNYYVF